MGDGETSNDAGGDDGVNMAALFAALGSAGAAPTEATGDARAAAMQLWQLGAAYVQAGFSPQESVYLLGQLLHGGALGGALASAMGGQPGEGSS